MDSPRRWSISLGQRVLLLLLIFSQAPAVAQERCDFGPGTLFQWSGGEYIDGGPDLSAPLVSDRPDFTEASSTVGVHVAQLEFGYTYFHDDAAGTSVDIHLFPEALLRYGIYRDWLELRIGLTYIEETTETAVASTALRGAEDLYLGFKIGLTPQDGIKPEMALIPQAFVPTGSAGINHGTVLPGVNWIYGWEVNDRISTAGSTQINRRVDGATDATFYRVAQSWTVALSVTERLGTYAEWFALFPTGADTKLPEHYFNGGMTFLVTDNFQLDVRAGVGLNEAAIDYFVGAGAVVRRW